MLNCWWNKFKKPENIPGRHKNIPEFPALPQNNILLVISHVTKPKLQTDHTTNWESKQITKQQDINSQRTNQKKAFIMMVPRPLPKISQISLSTCLPASSHVVYHSKWGAGINCLYYPRNNVIIGEQAMDPSHWASFLTSRKLCIDYIYVPIISKPCSIIYFL